MHTNHWRTPRASIATKFEGNDYGYVFHAGVLLKELFTYMPLHPKSLKDKKILDYGCGTGRLTKMLSLYSDHVVGYDPTIECITESAVETKKIHNMLKHPPLLTSSLSEVPTGFDIVVCINVLEHLNKHDFDYALTQITNKLADNGECFLWIHKKRNYWFTDATMIHNNMNIVRGIKIEGKLTFN